MVSFKNMVVQTMFVALFAFAMFAFVITLQADNNASNPIVNDANVNQTFTSLETEIESLSARADSQEDAFTQSTPGTGGLTFDLVAIVGTAFTFMSSIPQMLTLLTTALATNLGIPPLALSGFTAIVFIVLIYSAWRALRAGE